MSVNSVLITGIQMQYNAEYIARIFWDQNIAKVSSVTLLPYLQGKTAFQKAYVNIATWCDREVAYNFIQRLKTKGAKGTKIVYHVDYRWMVYNNTIQTNKLDCFEKYTTKIPETFYEKEEPKEVGIEEEKPVNAYKSDEKMSIETAKERIMELSKILYTTGGLEESKEIDFLEEQIYGESEPFEEPKIIPDFKNKEQMLTMDEAMMRLKWLEDYEDNYSEMYPLAKMRMAKCHEEMKYLSDKIDFHKNPQMTIQTQFQRFKDEWLNMSIGEAHQRLDCLKSFVKTFGDEDTITKEEIEFLEDQLYSDTLTKSENVTLRHHQKLYVA